MESVKQGKIKKDCIIKEREHPVKHRRTYHLRWYLAIKDEVKEAEQFRRSVYDILWREEREKLLRKAQGWTDKNSPTAVVFRCGACGYLDNLEIQNVE